MKCLFVFLCVAVGLGSGLRVEDQPAERASNSRAVANIVNFVRSLDPRMNRADCTQALDEEVKLNLKYGFKNTILFQYDALLDDEMMAIARRSDPAKTEYGVWFELCKPLVEKVGLVWDSKRNWVWDWHVNPGFLQAYAPAERRKIIDEVFAKFKATFGSYPKSAGSWFVDACSMDYMVERYGVDGFCICREQDSTDAYGLRGGYSNGAYYPSKKNMLSAAADMRNAVRAPVFKMLTPDPIYNYARPQDLYPDYPDKRGCPTLEPVWQPGYTPSVVEWYFRQFCDAPGLMNLSYLQLGQENAFGWKMISKGLPYQMKRLDELVRAGKLKLETMGETARRFKREHPKNCPQTQVALDDWTGAGRQSVWYNCANYRANLFLDKGRLAFRDVHVMRDDYAEPYLGKPCKAWNANYFTPPVFDAFLAISNACFRPFAFDGRYTALKVEGDGRSVLTAVATREDGAESRFVFSENGIAADGVDCDWSWFEGERKGYAFDGYAYSIGRRALPERKSFFIDMREEGVAFGPLAPSARPYERQYVWPEGKMPDVQAHQVAEKMHVVNAPGFDRAAHARPFIDWYAPADSNRTDLCVVTVSGGGFQHCCDAERLQPAIDRLVAAGITVADVTYRTPRPKGLPIHQTAWEDLQRAVRVVKSEAKKRGFSPDKVGATGISAGAKAVLMLATSSETRAYAPVDAIDDIPCNLLFAMPQAPAYVLTDGAAGANTRMGDGPDIGLLADFRFDAKTCPMCFFQGGVDALSPNGSCALYRQLRKMGIPAELHLFADRWHGFHGDQNRGEDGTACDHWVDRALEFVRQMNYDGRLGAKVRNVDRFPDDSARAECVRWEIWPKGRIPDASTNQVVPYLEWNLPRTLKTRAIQILFSGGGYDFGDVDGLGVAPARRYLNEKGMTVVTLRYRTPRPKGLPKYLSAWQDLQRTIRIVRSEAKARGLDPDRIGVMGESAGGHLAVMGATSSLHQSYAPVDALDKIPCDVQWAVSVYPAYLLTDDDDGKNTTGGNGDGVRLLPDMTFDLKTCPILFLHGDADGVSAMGSVKCWEQLRRMGVQGDLHAYATYGHCFYYSAAPGTGAYTWLDRIWEFLNHKRLNVGPCP